LVERFAFWTELFAFCTDDATVTSIEFTTRNETRTNNKNANRDKLSDFCIGSILSFDFYFNAFVSFALAAAERV